LQTREALDEKVKNARTALAVDGAAFSTSAVGSDGLSRDRGSVTAAFNILST